jgi:hypothetical protein
MRWFIEWGKIFVSCLSDKELISGIYKELKKLNTNRQIVQLVNKQMN